MSIPTPLVPHPEGGFATLPFLSRFGWLRHGISLRWRGRGPGRCANPMSLSEGGGEGTTARNRSVFLRQIGCGGPPLRRVRQVHGAHVHRLEHPLPGAGRDAPPQGDGLVTAEPRVPLAILTADCIPLFLVHPQTRTIGLVHAGRVGTLEGIARQAVDAMTSVSGARPTELWAALGPGIGPCCYRLDDRAIDPFRLRFPNWPRFLSPAGEGTWTLDLAWAITLLLEEAGMRPDRVLQVHLCTFCRGDWFFSHRRNRSGGARFLSVLMADAS